MRTLKEFIIKEGFLRKNLGLGDIALIKKWLDEYKIINYTINDDLTIDVEGSVYLYESEEKRLPDYIRFRMVTGDFYCYDCKNLESLERCPEKVGRSFDCSGCSKLESLEGCPKEVGESFSCNKCSKLKSLEGAPQEVGGSFECNKCSKLKSLKGHQKKLVDGLIVVSVLN